MAYLGCYCLVQVVKYVRRGQGEKVSKDELVIIDYIEVTAIHCAERRTVVSRVCVCASMVTLTAILSVFECQCRPTTASLRTLSATTRCAVALLV